MKTPFLTTSFSETGRKQKKRFENILSCAAKKRGMLALVGVVSAACLCGGCVANKAADAGSPEPFVVIGRDSGGRADIIMLADYDEESASLELFNFPRNLRAPGDESLAALCSEGKAAETLSEMTGREIEKYIYIDYEDFDKLIDAIGGVDFDVPQDMVYDDPYQNLSINLKQGEQHLTGEQAEMLVRYRKGNPDPKTGRIEGYSILDRMEVQNRLIKTVYHTVRQKFNAKTLPDLLSMLDGMDTNLKSSDLMSYIPLLWNEQTDLPVWMYDVEEVTDPVLNEKGIFYEVNREE